MEKKNYRVTKNKIQQQIIHHQPFNWENVLLTIIFSLFLIIVPNVPDIQITRPKLLSIEILTYIAVVIWTMMTIWKNKFLFRNTNFFIPVVIFGLYIILKYSFSVDKGLAFVELKRWMLSFVILYLLSLIEEKYLKWLIVSWLIGSGLSAVYGFLQHSGGFWRVQVPQMSRVMGMSGNPIFFAVHLVNFLPIILGLLFIGDKWIKKILLFVLFVITLITLYYTKTRAAYIAFAVSMLTFFYLNIKSRTKKIVLSTVLITSFVIFFLMTKHIWFRQQAHLLIWRDTLRMWRTKPFIGVGLGKFHTEFVNFASEELRNIWPQKQFIINDAHNEYVQLIAESGLIGLGLFILIFAMFFYQVLKIFPDLEKEKKYLVSGLLSGIVAVLVQNFFSVDMRFIISGVYLFLTMGIVSSYVFKQEEKSLVFGNKYIKIVSTIILLFLLGIISFGQGKTQNKKVLTKISFFGLAQVSSEGLKFGAEDIGNGLLQYILRPYLAQQKLNQEKDFFDEKIVDAAKSLQELLDLKSKHPDKAIIYEKIAWIYAKDKIFDKAIENYLTAVKLNPGSFAAFNNLGNIMFYINRQEAIKYYKRSIEINPNQVDARLNLGITYYYEGQLNLAAEQFDEVLKLDPKNEKAIVMLKKMRE